MARGHGRARRATSRARGKTAVTNSSHVGVPQEFRDMLGELEADQSPPPTRPIKRRRVGDRNARSSTPQSNTRPLEATTHNAKDDVITEPEIDHPVQTVQDYSEDSDEEDFEWEEVEIQGASESAQSFAATPTDQDNVLSITIGGPEVSKTPVKKRIRKPATLAEKKMRLDTHKLHVLCLLFHCYIRNHWCNDESLQRSLRKLIRVPSSLIDKLDPNPDAIQMQRSRIFKDALKTLADAWRSIFTITAHGLTRPILGSAPKEGPLSEQQETFLDLKDFRDKAQTVGGSADYGAQLFCALLRGIGLDSRLVCSLQPLPFASAAVSSSPARTHSIPTIYAVDSDNEEKERATVETQRAPPAPRRISRLGASRNQSQPSNASTAVSIGPSIKKPLPRPRHPVFWVEVFDEAYQAWIPIDTMATGSLGKPMSLEPGLNDPVNLLSYVIAFEEDGVARDVTRRYAKAYNAKTRKLRVECTDRGIEWFKKSTKPFRRRKKLDRERIEDAAFLQKDISEGMPRNIEDFKGHPVYVLERHLHQDQVVHPKKQVGRVGNNAKAADLSNLEPVYRRQDVHNVKSADRWFRLGRELKEGSKPLKHINPRRRRELLDDLETHEAPEQEPTIGLYAQFQTEVYEPPPVRGTEIPKNGFGNIDVYVQTMIPAGAVQIKSSYARQAAKVLSIDYADAVTGFKFQGRHGTAIINGVVVALEYKDAMVAVLEGISYAREVDIEAERSARALAMWRRFILGLRIVERVEAYKQEDEESGDDDDLIRREIDEQMRNYHEVDDKTSISASLLPDTSDFEVLESLHKLPIPEEVITQHSDAMSDLFEEPEEGGFLRETRPIDVANNQRTLDQDHGGGGFLLDAQSPSLQEQSSDINESLRGGFIVEDVEPADPQVDDFSALEQRQSCQEAVDLTSQDTDSDIVKEQKAANKAAGDTTLHQTPSRSPLGSDQSLLSHDPEDDYIDPDWLD